jgi:NitT/TauT family transport system substrate-binding protein
MLIRGTSRFRQRRGRSAHLPDVEAPSVEGKLMVIRASRNSRLRMSSGSTCCTSWAVALLGACSLALASWNAVAQGVPQTVRVAVVKATVLAPVLLLAKHLPPGWKTELTYFSSPGDMTNALLTDSVDLAYIGITVAVIARSKDQPIAVVANIANKGTAIVARADSAIRTIEDLKGKRVGNLPASIHDILLREELKQHIVPLDQVTLIRLAPADMPAALQRGDIDAFSGNEPNSSLAILGGYGKIVVYPYDTPIGGINVGVLTSDKVIKDKAAMLRVWAIAHAKATEEMAADPEAWADTVSREWGYDRASTRKSIDNIELVWKMDPAWLKQFAVFMDRLKELSVISKIPEFDHMVVREFVDQVKF